MHRKDQTHMANFSLARVHGILRKHLKNARWKPHLLTDEQKISRFVNAKRLVKMFLKYSKKSFNNLLSGDETWVYYFEQQRKCSNRAWATKNAVRPSKRERTVNKVLYVIFSVASSQANDTKFCQRKKKKKNSLNIDLLFFFGKISSQIRQISPLLFSV